MRKFRDNIFYLSTIIGILAWVVHLIYVMNICGTIHPIILRELFFLAGIVTVFFAYARKSFMDITEEPFNGRAEISKGDVLVIRFLGPWVLLLVQLFLMVSFILMSFELKHEPKHRVCEYRGRYR